MRWLVRRLAVLGAVGLACLTTLVVAIGRLQVSEAWVDELAVDGATASGQVTQIHVDSGAGRGSGTNHWALVAFDAPPGREQRAKIKLEVQPRYVVVGEPVAVRYDPADPVHHASTPLGRTTTRSSTVWWLVVACAAVGFFATAMWAIRCLFAGVFRMLTGSNRRRSPIPSAATLALR